MAKEKIVVRSHVSRDFLQSAGLFKTDKLVVWEYVSNSLQYLERGVNATVVVKLDSSRKEMEIADNGRGMDRVGLKNFFLMHGENQDRKAGRVGRGRFGTGKCAAFGIADHMRVTSVRSGKRNTVELLRSDIDKAGEHHIPVRVIEQDVPTKAPNGTTVSVSGIRLRMLDQASIIRFLEKHLARWPGKPSVVVNGHECESTEPPVADVKTFKPDQKEKARIGDATLTLKIAKAPLDPEMQGGVIFANGVWLETTLAGADGQPMSQYIFGEIDVPALDEDRSSIPAFDMSRSMQLNQSNELVQAVLAFIGRHIDQLRRQLLSQDQTRRAQEEAKKLAREADRIADIINRDFHEFSDRIARVRARTGTGRDPGADAVASGDEEDRLSVGGNVPARKVTDSGDLGGRGGENGNGDAPPRLNPVVTSDADGDPLGKPQGGTGKSRRSRGGFSVEFKEMGSEAPRATYASAERAIYVNLEHPQILAAKGSGGTEELQFRRLAYEVAFCEYAIALASELATQNEYIEPSEPIFDIRDTLNRMARRAAELYAR